MARIRIPCGHIDFPCCGCDDVVLTGEDAIEQIREEEEEKEPFDGFLTDAEADGDALASAGMGTDEDYGCAEDMLCEGYNED